MDDASEKRNLIEKLLEIENFNHYLAQENFDLTAGSGFLASLPSSPPEKVRSMVMSEKQLQLTKLKLALEEVETENRLMATSLSKKEAMLHSNLLKINSIESKFKHVSAICSKRFDEDHERVDVSEARLAYLFSWCNRWPKDLINFQWRNCNV